MGGNAFRDDESIHVKRMPSGTYHLMKDKYLKLLLPHFARVGISYATPGKLDHGDIDFLVSNPAEGFTWSGLQHALDAVAIRTNNPQRQRQIFYFAVNTEFPLTADEGGNQTVATHTQLDLYQCPIEDFDWILARNSYGDLWWILSQILHPFGFFLNGHGFYVVIEELKGVNGNQADADQEELFLTNDPMKVLQFAGLDEEMYKDGFESATEGKTLQTGVRPYQIQKITI